MTRLQHELLDEDPIVAEGVLRLVDARREALVRFLVIERHAQALAAAARRSLDHHRVADTPGDLHRLVGARDRFVVARDSVDLGFERELLRFDLVAHLADRIVLRPDELDPFLLQAPRKLGVLGQKAVAGVYCFGAGLLARGKDLVDHQIGFLGRRRPDAYAFIGHLDEQRVFVRLGIDGDGRDAHPAGGLDDPAGDFPAIRNQYLLEHCHVSPAQSGMLPCLRHGFSSSLSLSMASERHTRLRVS